MEKGDYFKYLRSFVGANGRILREEVQRANKRSVAWSSEAGAVE